MKFMNLVNYCIQAKYGDIDLDIAEYNFELRYRPREGMVVDTPEGPMYRIKSTKAVSKCKMIISTVTKDGEGRHIMLYDDLYEGLTDNTQNFFTQYEIGHLVLKHLDKENTEVGSEDNVPYTIKDVYKHRCIDDVFAADAYATEKVGKDSAIKALKEVRNLQIQALNFRAVRELNSRIKEVKKL